MDEGPTPTRARGASHVALGGFWCCTVEYVPATAYVRREARVLFGDGAVHLRPSSLRNLQNFLLHRILRYMYEALNIDENKKLITQFDRKSQDKSFDPR